MKLLSQSNKAPAALTSAQHMDKNEVSYNSTIWLT